jgi:hypothetical protein
MAWMGSNEPRSSLRGEAEEEHLEQLRVQAEADHLADQARAQQKRRPAWWRRLAGRLGPQD